MNYTACIMAPSLETVADVSLWFGDLLRAGINFHPEDTFANEFGESEYTGVDDHTAVILAGHMDRAYEIADAAGADINGLALAEFRAFLGGTRVTR